MDCSWRLAQQRIDSKRDKQPARVILVFSHTASALQATLGETLDEPALEEQKKGHDRKDRDN